MKAHHKSEVKDNITEKKEVEKKETKKEDIETKTVQKEVDTIYITKADTAETSFTINTVMPHADTKPILRHKKLDKTDVYVTYYPQDGKLDLKVISIPDTVKIKEHEIVTTVSDKSFTSLDSGSHKSLTNNFSATSNWSFSWSMFNINPLIYCIFGIFSLILILITYLLRPKRNA